MSCFAPRIRLQRDATSSVRSDFLDTPFQAMQPAATARPNGPTTTAAGIAAPKTGTADRAAVPITAPLASAALSRASVFLTTAPANFGIAFTPSAFALVVVDIASENLLLIRSTPATIAPVTFVTPCLNSCSVPFSLTTWTCRLSSAPAASPTAQSSTTAAATTPMTTSGCRRVEPGRKSAVVPAACIAVAIPGIGNSGSKPGVNCQGIPPTAAACPA